MTASVLLEERFRRHVDLMGSRLRSPMLPRRLRPLLPPCGKRPYTGFRRAVRAVWLGRLDRLGAERGARPCGQLRLLGKTTVGGKLRSPLPTF